MKLQEEYLARHNIQNFPVIYYVRNAHVILKLKSRPQIILNIKWIIPELRSGRFILRYLSPVHDSWRTGEFFEELDTEYICHYQDYASYITRWANNLDFQPVESQELDLAIFEMFLYCFDGWISESNELLEYVFNVVESKDDKSAYLTAFLNKLKTHDELAFEAYKEFLKFKDNYAMWLVNLINRKT